MVNSELFQCLNFLINLTKFGWLEKDLHCEYPNQNGNEHFWLCSVTCYYIFSVIGF